MPRKLSQREIAEKTGYHKSQISRWLSGKTRPSIDKALHVCRKCNLPENIFTSRAAQMLYFGKVFLKKE